jgi:hypothetical protein
MNSVVIGHALLKMPSMDVQAIPYWLRVHFAYIWSDSTEGVCTLHRREYYGLVFQPGHRAIHATHRAGNRRCSGTRSFASLFAS